MSSLWNIFYFVCRLVSLVLLLIALAVCMVLMPIRTLPFPLFARMALYLIGFNIAPHKGVIDPDAKILISNHPGCYVDGLIWSATLPLNVGFVAREDGKFPARNLIHALDKHRKCVLVSYAEKQNTVQRMKDFLNTYSDKKLMIAAEGSPASECGFVPNAKFFKFRTGGFRVADKVQPILIKSIKPIPDVPKLTGEIVPYMWRHRAEPPITIYIEYLPSVTRNEDESVEDFIERVRSNMQSNVDDMFQTDAKATKEEEWHDDENDGSENV